MIKKVEPYLKQVALRPQPLYGCSFPLMLLKIKKTRCFSLVFYFFIEDLLKTFQKTNLFLILIFKKFIKLICIYKSKKYLIVRFYFKKLILQIKNWRMKSIRENWYHFMLLVAVRLVFSRYHFLLEVRHFLRFLPHVF